MASEEDDASESFHNSTMNRSILEQDPNVLNKSISNAQVKTAAESNSFIEDDDSSPRDQ